MDYSVIYIFVIIFVISIFFIIIQPIIVLIKTWSESNFSNKYLSQDLDYYNDITGFDGLPNISHDDQLIGRIADSQDVCADGFYMGSIQMVNIDCTHVCSATNSSQFTYKFISENNIVINNRYLRRGGWCLPSSLARCNLNISIAVKSVGKYECISKYPRLFGGLYGNDITGCSPLYEFKDNLKKITYSQSVPSTLVIQDLDERLPNSLEYRYACNTNKQFASFLDANLGDRFNLHYNSCNFFDTDGHIKNQKCECTNKIAPHNLIKPLMLDQNYTMESICTTCTSGYGIVDEQNAQYGSKYGISIGVNCVDPEHIEYYKTYYIEMNGVLPCGVHTLSKIREERVHYGCQRALLNITNTYTPQMLQLIDDRFNKKNNNALV